MEPKDYDTLRAIRSFVKIDSTMEGYVLNEAWLLPIPLASIAAFGISIVLFSVFYVRWYLRESVRYGELRILTVIGAICLLTGIYLQKDIVLRGFQFAGTMYPPLSSFPDTIVAEVALSPPASLAVASIAMVQIIVLLALVQIAVRCGRSI